MPNISAYNLENDECVLKMISVCLLLAVMVFELYDCDQNVFLDWVDSVS